MVEGLMLRVGSAAAWVILQTAAVPLFGVTVICDVLDDVLELAEIFEMVILNAYCADAPGSPEIAAPLFVDTELAVYDEGNEIPILSVPVSVNVSLEEFDVPEIVTEPPVFATVAVESIVTNSVFPDWVTERVFESTPEAENVAVVVLAVRPVCSEALNDTVSFPLPLVFDGFNHDAYAI